MFPWNLKQVIQSWQVWNAVVAATAVAALATARGKDFIQSVGIIKITKLIRGSRTIVRAATFHVFRIR